MWAVVIGLAEDHVVNEFVRMMIFVVEFGVVYDFKFRTYIFLIRNDFIVKTMILYR